MADERISWEEVQHTGGNRDLPFQDPLRRVGASDARCATAATEAADGVEIFAYDASGVEIAETRRSAKAPLGTAFLGSGILGLRATGDVILRNVKLFGYRPVSITSSNKWRLLRQHSTLGIMRRNVISAKITQLMMAQCQAAMDAFAHRSSSI